MLSFRSVELIKGAAMKQDFDPNAASFGDCMERVRAVQERIGLDPRATIVTSRDSTAREGQQLLRVSNVPDDGFSKWQLPVFLDKPSHLFITYGQPNIDVPEHSHDEGDGIRFIASGSIIYRDQELTTGDWMFVPAGIPYTFKTGPFGALMCYCYCCCCVHQFDLAE
jgi:hypothetical protein